MCVKQHTWNHERSNKSNFSTMKYCKIYFLNTCRSWLPMRFLVKCFKTYIPSTLLTTIIGKLACQSLMKAIWKVDGDAFPSTIFLTNTVDYRYVADSHGSYTFTARVWHVQLQSCLSFDECFDCSASYISSCRLQWTLRSGVNISNGTKG